MNQNIIRAVYGEHTIRVYQAYSDPIADAALAHGTFVSPPFKMERMTWIKPSFLWMMYRAGWGLKDEGQKRILAKEANRRLGKLRTVIGHINRKLKIFKILSLPYRNRRKRFGLRVNLIAGLVNAMG